MTDVITAVLQLPAPIAAAVTLEAGEIITAQVVQPAAPIAAAITVAGPAGPAGPTGAAGPTGPAGPAGPSGSGAVASVFGRAGIVTAQAGDYTAAQVGADTATARDTAITTAIAPLATSSALTTGLAGKQPTSADLTAIAGLDSSTAGAIASDGAGWVKKTYAQFKTALGLVKADVGLGNVDNTSDVNKPVSTAQAATDALALKIASNLSDLNNAATARSNLGVPAGSGTSTGTNTGDQTLPTTLPPSGAAGGDLTGTYPNPGVAKVNGTSLAGLSTGLVKNTTGTGVPSIAAAADVPTVAAGSTGPLAATDTTTTNARTPTAHASTHAPGAADDLTTALSASAVPVALGTAATGSGTGFARQGHVHPTTGLILTGDSRLTDARTPTAHAASHASGGSDAVTLAESQVTGLVADLATAAKINTAYGPGTMEAGAVAETMSRKAISNSGLTKPSGTFRGVLVDLPAGQVITSISVWISGTALAGGTHSWGAVLDSTGKVLAVSNDDTTATQSATTKRTFTLTSPLTIPSHGGYYLGNCFVATTMPTYYGLTLTAVPTASTPFVCGSVGSQTTPPAVNAVLTLGQNTSMEYGFAS